MDELELPSFTLQTLRSLLGPTPHNSVRRTAGLLFISRAIRSGDVLWEIEHESGAPVSDFEQAQTVSMNEANSNAGSSSNPLTVSEYDDILEKSHYPIDEVPQEYKCSITHEIMIDPVFDPKNPDIKFDRRNICRALSSKSENPFTRLP